MDMEKKSLGGDEEDLFLLHKQEAGCLIQKILVWLPVVSLLRFKAVCKSWRDLIQSPLFIDLHTPITLNSSSDEFGSFILHVYDRFCPPPDSYSDYQSLLMLSSHQSDYYSESEEEEESVSISGGGGGGGGSNDDDDEEEVVVVVDDLGFDMDKKAIVGSCNGLVCVRVMERGPNPSEVSLWNPATGQSWLLPESIPIPGGICSLLIFGFDVETKDYKVVLFTWLLPRWNGNGSEFCFCRVQLYSLSTNSWRLLEGIPCLPGHPFIYQDSVVYLNGTCFFLAHFFYTERYPCLAENNRFIISFDFTNESITPIQLPDHHREQELCLCSLGDKIALFTSPNPAFFEYDAPSRNYEDINIWVLNYERGSSVNKKSWTNLHSFQIQLPSLVKSLIKNEHDWYIPRGISNDGKFALLASEYGRKMNLYNFATKEVVKGDFLSCRNVVSKAHAYKQSLVSVIGGNGGNGAGSSSSR